MFAVKGWSVSADNLIPEKQRKKKKEESSETKPSKKRKRNTQKRDPDVTDANVADLWESVIGGKPSKQVSEKKGATPQGKQQGQARDGKKKRRKGDGHAAADSRPETAGLASDRGAKGNADEDSWDGLSDKDGENQMPDSGQQPLSKKLKTEKQQKQDGKDKPKNRKRDKDGKGRDRAAPASEDKRQPDAPAAKPKETSSTSPTAAQSTASSAAPPLPPPAAKLTPLQASMRAKLVSARFRHLNETLYTRPSDEALRLFTESPEMFSEYHEGFRRQVEVWPENPVEGYIRDIRLRAALQQPHPAKGGKPGNRHNNRGGSGAGGEVPSLPHTKGLTTIADLGCGDARLAATLLPESRKLRLAIHSFDLHSPSPHVTRADIANVPLADGSVDVAIFCLALMGTNWLDFIEEAYRILRWKGELWVAEIKSRFGTAGQRRHPGPVNHSVGGRKKKQQQQQQQATKKGGDQGDGPVTDMDRQDLAVEVDGAEDRRGETDVSAFVEALLKRGFVLQGEPDVSNKMFVRMLFVKAASPTKGKGVVQTDAKEKNKKQKRFVWEDQDADGVDEAGILKPCVYKLR